MSATLTQVRSYGRRTLPQALDEHAASPNPRLYATIPKERDLSGGFLDVSCREMAKCVDYMAYWLVERLGRSSTFKTLAYIGIPDLRGAVVFLCAVKCGYKVLLPSPRNTPATNQSLMEQTDCTAILYAAEIAPVLKPLFVALHANVKRLEIPSFEEMLQSEPAEFPFEKDFDTAQNDPIVILHSSGSTGIPKPITMTHATFAVLDMERHLPTVPGRKNRDYSIWDFNGGGKFYTIFPYFHLAGFLSILVNPIFTESSSPVLGPPLMPPSGHLLREVMRHQSLRALYLPPSIAEQLLAEPGGIEFFKGLDFLCYTGGPFSPSAGEKLSKVTELCPLYGSTEAFQVPQLAPPAEDWSWMEWNPCFKVSMEPSDDEPGTFELVLHADESTRSMSALNHNMPGVAKYRTKDLFKQHPQKPGLWKYYGRRDDIIVLSNGEKFNPVPLELHVQAIPAAMGALVVGQGRSRAALLIEPKPDDPNTQLEGLKNEIWSSVEEANKLLPAQGRILRDQIIIAKPEKPFIRAGKGTIVRKLTEKDYGPEIDDLYKNDIESGLVMGAALTPSVMLHYNEDTVLEFVRTILTGSFPEFADILDDDDLFSFGMDSVMIGQFLHNMKTGIEKTKPGSDLKWLDTRAVYRHSSVSRLAAVVAHFLNSDKQPEDFLYQSRFQVMESLVEKYTRGLFISSFGARSAQESRTVALVGSTGYLGPRILASLLADPFVSSIYCLNRDVNAQQKMEQFLAESGHEIHSTFEHRVKYAVVDIGAPQLGLSQYDWEALSGAINTIIYNAWRPNFELPISSFEKPFLSGLRHLIDWSCASPSRPRIVFVSSIAAVGNWSRVHPKIPEIPEAPIDDFNVAMHMGYGESKCVAERILQAAHKYCNIPVSVVRTGQIGGPSPPISGQMPVQGWLLSLAKSSKFIGALPTRVSPVDWVPVDVIARQISSVASNGENEGGYQVFNLVHPDVQPWSLFLDTLTNRFGLDLERINLGEWLVKVEGNASDEIAGSEKHVALGFVDFLRSLGYGMDDMRCVSRNIGEMVELQIEPLTEQLIAGWIQGWDI